MTDGARAPLRAGAALCAALVMSGIGLAVHAQPETVRNQDNSVTVRIDDQVTTIPAEIATALNAALREHSGNPQALRTAGRAIVAASAADAGCGNPEDKNAESAERCTTFMRALVVFVALESGADPVALAVIVESIVAEAPTVEPQALLAALAAVETAETDAQSTAEEPDSASPIQ